ncbi:Thioredoxin-like [Mucilaginibacter pineti]|uniref:Thioredoxin-like n=1 Tax=Mucilaginibacter pineti TaxID=1391627 RepID=A0A1G7IRU2_9SPHI|nr:thioredoxin fold domain-containing protein [Mucilaginibacter pineti]SDF15296.1 Thioredoxin-like [Mucilaginibacter pineti]
MIKNLFLIGIFLCPVILMAQSQGITFTDGLSWKEVQLKAKAENKFIFMDVYATWCGPCKQMDREIYAHPTLGDLMNPYFISVKVQMDTSKNDSQKTRSFYKDAAFIKYQFHIESIPTFLFFNSNGELLNKDAGAKNIKEFTSIIRDVENTNWSYPNQVERYRKNELNYSDIRLLYKKALVMNEALFADSLARDIKVNFLDKISPDSLLKKDNLSFLGKNINLVSSNDLIFKLTLQSPRQVDSIFNEGKATKIEWADWLVSIVIQHEEIDNVLSKRDKRTFNFDRTVKKVKLKYPLVNADKIILKGLYFYYASKRDWINYSIYYDKFLTNYPPSTEGNEAFFALNSPAWILFSSTGKEQCLKFALKWIEKAIKIKPQLNDHIQFLDTRANILYRLGKTDKAIDQENVAIEGEKILTESKGQVFDPKKDDIYGFGKVLEKMRSGLPTWPTK